MPRTTMPRSREQSLAAAQPVSRTTADGAVRAGNYVRVRPRFHRPSLHPSDHSGRPRIRPATTVPSYSAMTRSSGRSSRPTVQRRGRPEARFEARFIFFKARLNPKPPLKT
ncbi:unnamed protein product [Microthlaspi erraticum]|uniref:Uncharacterized protein n=1 Tax=Microthlaspi erraticum TaxID=1685480 RepID=A0A6D2JTL3_9BRAS|nr:unnamed protein product [Microthlaspi erraticum]